MIDLPPMTGRTDKSEIPDEAALKYNDPLN